jgi:hypothetical protein
MAKPEIHLSQHSEVVKMRETLAAKRSQSRSLNGSKRCKHEVYDRLLTGTPVHFQ